MWWWGGTACIWRLQNNFVGTGALQFRLSGLAASPFNLLRYLTGPTFPSWRVPYKQARAALASLVIWDFGPPLRKAGNNC